MNRLPTIVFFDADNHHIRGTEDIVKDDSQAPIIGTARVGKDFQGNHPFGGRQTYQHIEITLNEGTIVRAYRLKSPDNKYNICENE